MSNISQGLLDTTTADNNGPYFAAIDTEPERAGIYRRRGYRGVVSVPGYGDKTGGISYVNPHDGSSMAYQPRVDAMKGTVRGPVGRRINSGFIGGNTGGHIIAADPIRGDVGRNRTTYIQRAQAQNDVVLPDAQKVSAAFTSPALANFIGRLRRRP